MCYFDLKQNTIMSSKIAHASISGNVQFLSLMDSSNELTIFSLDLWWGDSITGPNCSADERSNLGNHEILQGFQIEDMKLSWIGDRVTVVGRNTSDDSIHVFTSSLKLIPAPPDLIPYKSGRDDALFFLEKLEGQVEHDESAKFVSATLTNEGTTLLLTYESTKDKSRHSVAHAISKVYFKNKNQEVEEKMVLKTKGAVFKHAAKTADALFSIAVSEHAKSVAFLEHEEEKSERSELKVATEVADCKENEVALQFTDVLGDASAVDSLTVYSVQKMRGHDVVNQVFMNSEVKGNVG